MNLNPSRDARLALFSAFLDGRCSAASERDVLHLLEQDAAARQDFAELSQMHLWLSEDADTRRVLARADCAPDNIIPLPGLVGLPGSAAAAMPAAGMSAPQPQSQPRERAAFLRDLRPLAASITAAVAALALLPAGAWILQRQFIDPILPGRAPGQTSMAWWNSSLTAPSAVAAVPAGESPSVTKSPARLIAYSDQCVSCHAPGSHALQRLD